MRATKTRSSEVIERIREYYAGGERNEFTLRQMLRDAEQALKSDSHSSDANSAPMIVHSMGRDRARVIEAYRVATGRVLGDDQFVFAKNAIKALFNVAAFSEWEEQCARAMQVPCGDAELYTLIASTSALAMRINRAEAALNRLRALGESNAFSFDKAHAFLSTYSLAEDDLYGSSEAMLVAISAHTDLVAETAVGLSVELDPDGSSYLDCVYAPYISWDRVTDILLNQTAAAAVAPGAEKIAGRVVFDIRNVLTIDAKLAA